MRAHAYFLLSTTRRQREEMLFHLNQTYLKIIRSKIQNIDFLTDEDQICKRRRPTPLLSFIMPGQLSQAPPRHQPRPRPRRVRGGAANGECKYNPFCA